MEGLSLGSEGVTRGVGGLGGEEGDEGGLDDGGRWLVDVLDGRAGRTGLCRAHGLR